MTPDYHLHTPYCGHARGKTVQYIERAIELSMPEICFTDHLGRYYLTRVQSKRYWDWGMDERTLPRYTEEIAELSALFSDRIVIKIGMEIDYVEGAEDLLRPFLNFYPFDFFLGSIHCLPRFGWKHLSNYTEFDSELVVKEYFRCAREAMTSGIFHALAHLDFIWRYIRWPESRPIFLFEKEIEETAIVAATSGCCIEINANAYLWSMEHIPEGPDPFIIMISQLADRHVPITIGSDAHDPLLVGKSFGEMVKVVRSFGITERAVFTKGCRQLVPLV